MEHDPPLLFTLMGEKWMALITGAISRFPEETESLGESLAQVIPPNTVIIIRGDLETGKTTFVRGIAKGLSMSVSHIDSNQNDLSFHDGKTQLLHLTANRLKGPETLKEPPIDAQLRPPWVVALECEEPIDAPWLHGAWTVTCRQDPETKALRLSLQIPADTD